MISVSGLTMQFGKQILFEDVAFQLNPGNHYGLAGANGSGKSTLLKILSGQVKAESGEVSIPNELQIGILEQDHFAYEELSLAEVVMMGRKGLHQAMVEKERLLAHSEFSEEDGIRLAELEMLIADQDGYTAEAEVEELLAGLGIQNHSAKLKELSGGYKLRVLLAKCLFGKPDFLMLDEPTNHLDLGSIRWLEEYLHEFNGATLIISHDRHFLNRVCNHILDIDYETVRLYKGNYDQFVSAKYLEREQKEAEIQRQEKKKEEMQAFVDRFKAKATKARQASSKAKQIEKMQDIVIKRSSRVAPAFRLKQRRPSGKEALELIDVTKAFGEKRVLNQVGLKLKRGERLGVIGPNGIGKSTLIKIIAGDLAADSGEVNHGHELRMGYFPQDHKEVIPHGTTPYEWLYSFEPGETIGKIRSLLGQVLLQGDDVHKLTENLSGGEAARLIMARLMLLEPNLILIDEPTNHMDIETIESLSESLRSYEGSVVFVSHDRNFIEEVATAILELSPEGYQYYPYNYGEYLEKKGQDHLDKDLALKQRKEEQRQKTKEETPAEDQPKKLSFKEQKELGKLKSKAEKLEAKIEELEAKIAELDQALGDPKLYTLEGSDRLRKLQGEKEEVQGGLDKAHADWEKAQSKLEAMGG